MARKELSNTHSRGGKLYECTDCLAHHTTTGRLSYCPDCGGEIENLTKARAE